MQSIVECKLKTLFAFFLCLIMTNDLFADVNRSGVICFMEDGYNYGYSFNNGEVASYKFIVTDNKVLSNIEPLGSYYDKSDYVEWKISFSGRIFWFRLNKTSYVLTTEGDGININFNHQCETHELMEWNRRLSILGDRYQFEYDKYLKYNNEYNEELKDK